MKHIGIKEIIKFELLCKLLILGFVHPVLSLVMNLFVKIFIQEDTLFNANIFLRILTSPGIIFLLIYGCIYLIFIYYEYIVFLKMIALEKKGIIFDFKDVAYTSLFKLKELKKPDSVLSLVHFIILNPLWHLGYIQTFLPTFEIPPFITGEIIKMN